MNVHTSLRRARKAGTSREWITVPNYYDIYKRTRRCVDYVDNTNVFAKYNNDCIPNHSTTRVNLA